MPKSKKRKSARQNDWKGVGSTRHKTGENAALEKDPFFKGVFNLRKQTPVRGRRES